MCEEESEDHEAVAKLLEINDSIHRTIERYKLIKKGDVNGANQIPKGTLGTSGAGVKKGPDNELSLIDFGGPEDEPAPGSSAAAAPPSTGAPAPPAKQGNLLEDDLLGLSIGPGDTFGQGGQLSLGMSNGPPQAVAQQIPIPTITQQGPPPQQQPAIPEPNYDPFGLNGLNNAPSMSPPPSSNSMASVFGQSAPQQQQPQQPSQPRDPFASLAQSTTPRTGSPFQFQQSVNRSASPSMSGSATLLELGGGAPSSQPTSPRPPMGMHQPKPSTGSAAVDDEWTFSSSLPDQAQDLVVTNSSVNITWNVSRPPEQQDVILIKSRISNNTPQPLSDFTFQVAVTKVPPPAPCDSSNVTR